MKNSTLKYLVIGALLINAATLIFFWWTRPSHRGAANKPPFQVLIDALQLDEKQQKIYHTLHRQHHQSTDSLLQLIGEKRKVLYSETSISLDWIMQEISSLQQQIERITFHHFEDVRNICTPEQQKKLDDILLRTVQQVLLPNADKRPPPGRN